MALPGAATAAAAVGATGAAQNLAAPFVPLFDTFRSLAEAAKAVIDPLGILRADVRDLTGKLTDMVRSALKPFAQQIGIAKDLFLQFDKSVSVVIAGVSSVVTGAVAAGRAFVALGSQMVSFVRLASPAAAQQFNNALDDLIATVGYVLTPILEAVTPILRAFADAILSLAPLGQAIGTMLKPFVEVFRAFFNIAAAVLSPVVKFFEAIAPVFASLSRVFGELMKAVEPVIRVLADLVGAMVTAFIKPLTDALNEVMPYIIAFTRIFADAIRAWVAGFRTLSGLGPERRPGEGDATGMAAKSAQVGSVQSVLERTMLSAYSLGTGSARPEDRTATAAEEIARKAEMIYQVVRRSPEAVTLIVNAILKVATLGSVRLPSFSSPPPDPGTGPGAGRAGS